MVTAINQNQHVLGNLASGGDLSLVSDENALARLATAIIARSDREMRGPESYAIKSASDFSSDLIDATSDQIVAGRDPLGEIFCRLRASGIRRQDGAVYTPLTIVDSILDWAQEVGHPDRVVDPGSGSGRFLLEAGRRFPDSYLIGIEKDPLAALISRANLAAAGMAQRSEVRVENFLMSDLAWTGGKTLYIGNPPYVRHHLIHPQWKRWFKSQAAEMGMKASALAGLHVYFFLKIASKAEAGDFGALITASEWLDVNYGQFVRDLFLDRLGGKSIHLINPKAETFPDAAATGAITTFAVNGRPRSARFARVDTLSDLGNLSDGIRVPRESLIAEKRWTHFIRTRPQTPEGYVELGEICRVHRGQVTGANRVWIAGRHSEELPDSVLFPAVTRAKELFDAGPVLKDARNLRRVIDLPEDLTALNTSLIGAVQNFLVQAEEMGAKDNYTARNRRPWWSVRLREPAPILATYMARRAPAFVLNQAKTRHLNVAHGLYPREELDQDLLSALVSFLRKTTPTHGGRVYAGGLTKFEPREMERIPVPDLHMLRELKT